MKIESKVESMRYMGPTTQCIFSASGNASIPIGAKVTVEWDEQYSRYHSCDALNRRHDSVEVLFARDDERWGLHRRELLINWVDFCPFCGQELE